jgi:hypothetical protein
MRLNTTTLVLGVALTVVAGLFSSTIFGSVGTKSETNTIASTSGLITGHVTAVVKDSAGNIKEYRQTDNLVVNQGENCAAKMLFSGGAATGTTVCTGANTVGFHFIEIGNGTTTVQSSDVRLASGHNTTGIATATGLHIKAGTLNWFGNATGSGSGTTTDTRIAATFTNNAAASQTVAEAALFNGTTHNTNGMFARQTFPAITLNNGDQLTVEWRINIGGTSNALTP